jgi:hypothetical protein
VGEEVTENAKKWLHEQGYPLESRVAHVFKAAGFRIERGRHWTDSLPDGSRKAREIDVIACDYPDEVDTAPIIRLVIECKHGKHPWIALAGDAGLSGSATDWLMVEPGSSDAFLEGLKHNMPPFHLQAPTAFGVVDMGKTTTRDDAYEAMTQAIRAAWKLANGSNPEVGLTFPIVVTDGPLVRLTYDTDGEELVEPTSFERVLWSGAVLDGIPDAGDDPAMIDVVQFGYLQEYAARSRQSTKALQEIMVQGAVRLAPSSAPPS